MVNFEIAKLELEVKALQRKIDYLKGEGLLEKLPMFTVTETQLDMCGLKTVRLDRPWGYSYRDVDLYGEVYVISKEELEQLKAYKKGNE